MIENLENEIWKDCKGYEGLYQVSNKGRVKSLQRVRTNHTGGIWIQKEAILKGKINDDGYKVVHLTQPKGKTRIEFIHRLVAVAFIENPDHKKEVNHINAIRTDNSVDNLEWATRKENIEDSVKRKHKSKFLVLCLQTGEVFSTTQEASKKNGGDAGNIRRSARSYDQKKHYSVYGYTYCYIKNEEYYKNLKNNNLEVIENG